MEWETRFSASSPFFRLSQRLAGSLHQTFLCRWQEHLLYLWTFACQSLSGPKCQRYSPDWLPPSLPSCHCLTFHLQSTRLCFWFQVEEALLAWSYWAARAAYAPPRHLGTEVALRTSLGTQVSKKPASSRLQTFLSPWLSSLLPSTIAEAADLWLPPLLWYCCRISPENRTTAAAAFLNVFFEIWLIIN